MQTGPAGFDAALAARQNLTVSTVAAEQQMTNGAATGGESVTVRRELAGDVPAEVALVAGAEQSTATVVYDARSQTVFHPLNLSNNIWQLNSTATVEAGYSNLRVPLFTGRVREIGFDEAARTLTYEARDAADRLAAPAYVPAYGSIARRDRIGSPVRHVTNTQGVITHLLHRNGIRMVPATRTGCVLSVPMVGGALADIGWTVGQAGPSPSPYLTAGRFGRMPAAGTEEIWAYPSTQVRVADSETVTVEAWYNHTLNTSTNEFLRVQFGFGDFTVSVASNRVYVYVRATPGGTQLQLIGSTNTLTAGWRHLYVELKRNALARLFVDGVLVETRSATWSTLPTVAPVDYVIIKPGRVQHVAMHVASFSTPTPPTSSVMSFTAQADLDEGALELAATPNVDGKTSWEALKEIAAAELGMVGFSESGRFFFKRLSTVRNYGAPVATWSLDHVAGFSGSVALDSVRTVATAEVTQATHVDSGLGADTPETTAVPSMLAPAVLELAPTSGTPGTLLVTGDKPWVPTQRAVSIITLASGAWNALTGMALCHDIDGVTRYTGSGVTAWWSPVSQTTWRLNYFNTESFSVFTAWPRAWSTEGGATGVIPFDFRAGSPALWVNGRSLPDDLPTQVLESESFYASSQWGRRVLNLGASPYWQNTQTVQAFLSTVLEGTQSPRPELADVTLPADPRWQLGDLVTLTDPLGLFPDIYAQITRIQVDLNRNVEHGMLGTYSLRAVIQ